MIGRTPSDMWGGDDRDFILGASWSRSVMGMREGVLAAYTHWRHDWRVAAGIEGWEPAGRSRIHPSESWSIVRNREKS